MSGPKVSDYELESRRQARLRRQYEEEQRRRQEEQRRRQEAERRRLEEQRRIEAHRRQQNEFRAGIRRNVDSPTSQKAEVMATVGEIARNQNCRFNVEAFEKLCAEADTLIKRSIHIHDGKEIAPKAFADCVKEAERLMELLIRQHKLALDERIALESTEFVNTLRSIRSIADTKAKTGVHAEPLEDKLYEKRTQDLYHSLCSMLADALVDMPDQAEKIQHLQGRLDSEVWELGGTPREIFQATTTIQGEIAHQVNVCRTEALRKQESEARRAELIRRYHYYCDELALPRMNVEELALQSEQALESLCATLDNRLFRQYEENYIYQCINEAMAELGYTLYGQGANGIRGQFLYQMHGDTVVHVSCSDQGIIAMEVGRAASGPRELDAAEVAEQVRDMETFCGDYAALQRALSEKGVTCRRNIVLSPPDPQFANVLDTSKYEIKKTVDTAAAQTAHRYIDGKG